MNQAAAIGITMLFGAIVWWFGPYQRWKLKRLAVTALVCFLAYGAIISGAAEDLAVAIARSVVDS